jgi:hypothetical protein
MFPFDISFTKHLSINDSNLMTLVFDCIQSKLEKLKVDKVVYENGRIDFKNNFLNGQGRWHLMAPVDGGYFDYSQAASTLKYSISTLTVFIFSFAFSCIVYFLSNSWTAGLFILLWLYGANWIIAMIRHQKFFNNLTGEIQMTLSNINNS